MLFTAVLHFLINGAAFYEVLLAVLRIAVISLKRFVLPRRDDALRAAVQQCVKVDGR